jgi:hypothetical protein
MNAQTLASAALDPTRFWLVVGPILLLISFLFFLLFVVFPNTDRRIRRTWITCMPLALILIAVDVLFPVDQFTFRGFDRVVEAGALMLFIAPVVALRSPSDTSTAPRGKRLMLVLLLAILPALVAFTISNYLSRFRPAFICALIAYGTFVIASALVKWQSGSSTGS